MNNAEWIKQNLSLIEKRLEMVCFERNITQRTDKDDLLQSTIVNLLSSNTTLSDVDAISTYIKTTVENTHNKSYDKSELKKAKSRHGELAYIESLDADISEDNNGEALTFHDITTLEDYDIQATYTEKHWEKWEPRVSRICKRLTDKQGRIFKKRYLEYKTIEEIAEAEGVTYDAITACIYRANVSIKKMDTSIITEESSSEELTNTKSNRDKIPQRSAYSEDEWSAQQRRNELSKNLEANNTEARLTELNRRLRKDD